LVYLDADGNAREGSFEMMREIQEVLVPLGGTPHWGKHMCADLYEWKELYGEWDNFKSVVKEMDPLGKWGNEWTKGLFE
jgi:hypothetical protein